MAIPKRFWLLLALLIAAIISWNILDISKTKKEPITSSDQQLDFYAHGINTLQTDIEGKPKSRLIAKTMLHFEKDDHTELEHPVTTLYQQEAPPWIIKAKHGFVTSEGKKITLKNNVSILRKDSKPAKSVLITTESITLEPDRNYAETADPVRIKSDNNIINAVGMTAYINEPMKINLLSNVRGEYEAP